MADLWYEDFKPATSGGVLPIKSMAKKFRFKKAIIWQVNLTSEGMSGVTATGAFTVTFTSPGGKVLYKSTIGIRLFMVGLGLPGIIFFTWNYVNDTFDTEIAGGVDVTDATIGQYLQGGTAASEQGLLLPTEGQESTNAVATIVADWYSPIYVNHRLPKGTKVTITNDTWGFGPKTVEYAWAFEEGSDERVDTTISGMGALLSARGVGEYTQAGQAWRGYQIYHGGGYVPGVSPSLMEDDDGLLILAVYDEEKGYIEYQSRFSGRHRWERIKYVNPETAEIEEQVIFEAGVTMPKTVRLKDGTRLALAIQGERLVVRRIERNIIQAVIDVMEADSDESYSMEEDETGKVLIVDGSGLPAAESLNGGRRWAAVAEVVA
jgi:hypothetical protein